MDIVQGPEFLVTLLVGSLLAVDNDWQKASNRSVGYVLSFVNVNVFAFAKANLGAPVAGEIKRIMKTNRQKYGHRGAAYRAREAVRAVRSHYPLTTCH